MEIFNVAIGRITSFVQGFRGTFLLVILVLSLLCSLTFIYIRNQTEFSSTMVLHKEIAGDCYPAALYDRNSNIHVVWQSDRNGNWDIFHMHSKSSLLGKEFVCITDNKEDDLFPSLAEDEKGNIWVVWIRNSTEGSSICGKVIESQEGINTEEKVFIGPDRNVDRKSPCLISIDSERMLLAWISKEDDDQEIEFVLIEEGHISDKEPICNTDNSKKVVFGKTEKGEIFALWDSMHMGENHLYLSFYDDNDKHFPSQETLKSETGADIAGNSPSLLVRRDGTYVLFFLNETGDISSSIKKKSQNGSIHGNYSEPQKIPITGAYESCPNAIENRNGEIYLFWASDFTGDYEIFYCNSPNIDDFHTENVQYEKGFLYLYEEPDQFIKNLTRDPNQNNKGKDGNYCNDIYFSVAVINEELWVVWDSYDWDLNKGNNRRQIKYVKMENDCWSQPKTIIDTSINNKEGKDDRCPVLAQTEDGIIWLFWHSDRYHKDPDENFEILYLKSEDGGNSWIWHDEKNFDPYRLTTTSAQDKFPSVSAIGKRIFVVWQSDVRLGYFDILYCEFDGEEKLQERHITYEDFSETNPQIASFGWSFAGIEKDEIIVAWQSFKGDSILAKYKYVTPESEVFQFTAPSNMLISFPSISYISRSKLLGKDPWFIWQYYHISGSSINIQYKDGDGNVFPVTDDFSLNERSKIIEFNDKIWFFWDSSGGGNGRGIYYNYMYTKEIPIWLSTFTFVLVAIWFLFVLSAGSKNIQGAVGELYESGETYFQTHRKVSDIMKFLLGAIISAIISILVWMVLMS